MALFSGQFFFLLITFYLHYSGQFTLVDSSLTNALMIVAPFIVMGGLSAAFFVVKNQLGAIKKSGNLKEKLTRYRATMILKYALLEGPSFFAIVCYLLTSHYLFPFLAGMIMLVFFINRPSAEKAMEELELSQEEIKQMNDPGCIV